MRYVVQVRDAQGSVQYIHAVLIRVIDTAAGPTEWHRVRRGVQRQWGGHRYQLGRFGRMLDARHKGPRSAFGKALAEAKQLADELNNQTGG